MTDGFKVLQTFSNAEDALQQLLSLQPDIVIMDVHLPGMSGIECIRCVHQKNRSIQFMMFTIYENSDTVFEALKAGASGYILKNSFAETIVDLFQQLYHCSYTM